MCELLLRDDTQHHSVRRTGLIPASQPPPHPHCSSFFHGEWKCITWRQVTGLAREWRAWGWPAQAPCSSQLQGVGAGTLALNRDHHLPSKLAAGVLGLFSSWAALGWVTWATDVPLMFQLLWTQKAFHPLLTPCMNSSWTSQVAQSWRICLPMQETRVPSLCQEDTLEKEIATHCSILA